MGNALQRHHGRMLSVQDMFDRLESGLFTSPWRGGMHGIRIEEQIDDARYQVKAELPGMDPDKDLMVDATGDVLTIRAEREERAESEGNSEFHYGVFARAVRLPAGVRCDKATAEYTDGILTVRIPREGKEEDSTKITVRRGVRE